MNDIARHDWRDPEAPLDHRIRAARADVVRHLLTIALSDPFWESITVRYVPTGELVFTNLADYAADARRDGIVADALLLAVAEHIDFLRSCDGRSDGIPEDATVPVLGGVTVYRDSVLDEAA
ncbi:hypothetical protein [Planctomonas psychrotolerans]|uniref:hypothetical protein n=1 Tax=Planctomonas psychrotolerans TaxID=2528712 RepID=UPI00123AFA5D|nr:hypothetical protein [Planctomonas psychrotolerans]